jgi:hypothetical protein
MTGSKVQVGDTVSYQGELFKVTAVSYQGHPELLLYGARAAPGWFCMLDPIHPDSTELDGWVNQRWVHKVKYRLHKGSQYGIRGVNYVRWQ